MSERYRTIVADPPWAGDWWPHGTRSAGKGCTRTYEPGQPSYDLMTLDGISALPVHDLAAEAAHLYLWTPDRHLIEGNAARVIRAWGFEPGRLIVWRKRNLGLGTFPRAGHESVVVCARGGLPFTAEGVPSVQDWKQPYNGRAKIHSAKPDGMLDLVEQASPGPYLEMFARRARMGWDYWGNESLGTAELWAYEQGTPTQAEAAAMDDEARAEEAA